MNLTLNHTFCCTFKELSIPNESQTTGTGSCAGRITAAQTAPCPSALHSTQLTELLHCHTAIKNDHTASGWALQDGRGSWQRETSQGSGAGERRCSIITITMHLPTVQERSTGKLSLSSASQTHVGTLYLLTRKFTWQLKYYPNAESSWNSLTDRFHVKPWHWRCELFLLLFCAPSDRELEAPGPSLLFTPYTFPSLTDIWQLSPKCPALPSAPEKQDKLKAAPGAFDSCWAG